MPKINKEKREQNRLLIVEHASLLFNSLGYNKTSVNDIIKNAQISKGMFYTYFESKEELFFYMIHRVDQEVLNSKLNFNSLNDYINFRLRRFLDETNKIRAKYTLEFWASANLNEAQKKVYQKRYTAFKEDIISIVKDGQIRGFYDKSIDLDHFAHLLMSSLDGIIFMDTVLHQAIDEKLIEMTVDMFTSYLKIK